MSTVGMSLSNVGLENLDWYAFPSPVPETHLGSVSGCQTSPHLLLSLTSERKEVLLGVYQLS